MLFKYSSYSEEKLFLEKLPLVYYFNETIIRDLAIILDLDKTLLWTVLLLYCRYMLEG